MTNELFLSIISLSWLCCTRQMLKGLPGDVGSNRITPHQGFLQGNNS